MNHIFFKILLGWVCTFLLLLLIGCTDASKNNQRVHDGTVEDSRNSQTSNVEKNNKSEKDDGSIKTQTLGSDDQNFLTSSHPSAKVARLMKKYCYACHGANQSSQGGLSQILDLAWLKSNGYIESGSASESSLWKKMQQNMPPVSHPQPTGKERKEIKDWIDSGAELEYGFVERDPIALSEIYGRAANALEKEDSSAKPFIRFIYTTNAYNAGYDENYLQDLQQGSVKLFNNLSLATEVAGFEVVPATEGTLLKIDLRKFGWDKSKWRVLVNNYPYLVAKSDGGFLLDLQQKTDDLIPILRADWFLANASIAPLYYALLEIPTTQSAFYADNRIAIDWGDVFQRAKSNPDVLMRSGFNGSQVAEFSRVLERVDLDNGGFLWQSYEFGSDSGNKNPFVNPLGPVNLSSAALSNIKGGPSDPRKTIFNGIGRRGPISAVGARNAGMGLRNGFAHDGNEIIFSLPNKMLGFAVFNSDGSRRNTAPSGTIDKTSTSTEVTIGVSCMSCHFKGLIDKKDQIRDAVLSADLFVEDFELESTLKNLYPESSTFSKAIERDTEVFQNQLAKIGVSIDREDPILRVFNTFRRHQIDLGKAAIELGQSEANVLDAIKNSELKLVLSPLLAEGGSISRNVFEDSVLALKKALQSEIDD